MHRRRTLTLALALVLVTMGLAGCLGGDTQHTTTYVKDAATDEFSEIWIRFTEVQVHHGDEDGDDGEWITTVDEERELDLLSFSSDDAKAFLGEEDLPTGTYTFIEITVPEAWGIKDDGSRTDFQVASNSAKIPRSWELPGNDTTAQLVIDLDLDRSLREAGGQGDRWVFTPVIGFADVNYVEDDPQEDVEGTS